MGLSGVYALFRTRKKTLSLTSPWQSSLHSNLKISNCLLKWEGHNVIQTSTDPRGTSASAYKRCLLMRYQERSILELAVITVTSPINPRKFRKLTVGDTTFFEDDTGGLYPILFFFSSSKILSDSSACLQGKFFFHKKSLKVTYSVHINEVLVKLTLAGRQTIINIKSTKLTAALKHGIRNPETETERNTESNINDRKFKNFTLHNLVQSKKNLF